MKDDKKRELADAIDYVCMRCVRPPADEGGEETCAVCYVRATYDERIRELDANPVDGRTLAAAPDLLAALIDAQTYVNLLAKEYGAFTTIRRRWAKNQEIIDQATGKE